MIPHQQTREGRRNRRPFRRPTAPIGNNVVAVTTWWRRLGQRVGHRGATLLFFAVLDAAFAFSLLAPLPETQRSAGILFIESMAPLWVWGCFWLFAAICCAWGAFVRRDQLAFFAAVGVKSLWGFLYLLMQVVVHVERAWLQAVLWLCLATFVYIISTWPEPQTAYTLRELQDRGKGLL